MQNRGMEMSGTEIKHIGLRVDMESYGKLRYIARYEWRTINSQVYHLIRASILEFEREHGPIPLEETDALR